MKNIEKYIMVILIFVAVGAIGAAVYFGINADKDNSKKEDNKQEDVLDIESNEVEIKENEEQFSYDSLDAINVKNENINIKINRNNEYIEGIYFNDKKIKFESGEYYDGVTIAEVGEYISVIIEGMSWPDRLELFDLEGNKIDVYECFPEDKKEYSVIEAIDGKVIVEKIYQPFKEPAAQFAEYYENWNNICSNFHNYAIVTYVLSYEHNEFVLNQNDIECSFVEY